MRVLLALLLLTGCAALTPPSPRDSTARAASSPPPCSCSAPAQPPPRIVHAKDGGPTLLSPADLAAIERYVRACSEGR